MSHGERSASGFSQVSLRSFSPSDAQLLYWTLEDDGVVPSGYEQDFLKLMSVVSGAAERQTRATFQDSPQAAL